MNSEFELHKDRLSTTDERGRRIFIHPADVRGRLRVWRQRVHFVLIFVFLLLPWIHVNGRQWVMLNIASGRFEIFGLSLRTHNAPLVFLCLAIAAFGLFLVTAIWGRVWCGWACPQTVFIDAAFRRIERWIDGPPIVRRKLDQSPWDLVKIRKRAAKWLLYTAISLLITHSFLAYFVGGRELLAMVTAPPQENWTNFLFILFTTALILVNFAWFREQFCTIVCPYGRLQSVLMDDHSMVVAYDAKRGEPRRTRDNKAAGGDCVNCYRCVQVCPTGIDIRRGTQMECIACTSCIDACDEVMTRLKRPAQLIRNSSERDLRGQPTRWLRARTGVYLAALITAVVTLAILLVGRSPVELMVLRAKGAPYDVIRALGREDVIVNRFKIEISNQSDQTYSLHFGLPRDVSGIELVAPQNPYTIERGRIAHADVFLRFSKSHLTNGQARLPLLIDETIVSEETSIGAISAHPVPPRQVIKEIPLVGPFM